MILFECWKASFIPFLLTKTKKNCKSLQSVQCTSNIYPNIKYIENFNKNMNFEERTKQEKKTESKCSCYFNCFDAVTFEFKSKWIK